MKIYRTTYRLVVYSEEPIPITLDLGDLHESIDTGPNIGEVSKVSEEILTDREQIVRQLVEIGNDGGFFAEACEECGADIPLDEPSMVNRHHDDSCSLYDEPFTCPLCHSEKSLAAAHLTNDQSRVCDDCFDERMRL